MKAGSVWLNWLLFASLAVIWGSSFILMKLGIRHLTPVQVASVRIISSGIILLPVAYRAFSRLNYTQQGFALLSGLLGSFFPAYLFCMAETKMDSALAGILNALTPVFVILIGVFFYSLFLRDYPQKHLFLINQLRRGVPSTTLYLRNFVFSDFSENQIFLPAFLLLESRPHP